MQKDLWKLYVNSRIFEFLTPCSKIKLLRMRKKLKNCAFTQATQHRIRMEYLVKLERNFKILISK